MPLGERPCFLPPNGELPGEIAVWKDKCLGVWALFLPRLGFRQHLSYIIGKRIKQYGLIHRPIGSGSYCLLHFFFTHGSQDQDWNVLELGLLPDLSHHFDAIESRHADIGYYEVRLLGSRQVKP